MEQFYMQVNEIFEFIQTPSILKTIKAVIVKI